MRFLIIGGAGYIGLNTALEIAQQGYEADLFDNFSNSNYDKISKKLKEEVYLGNKIKVVRGDLMRMDDVCRAISARQYDSIFHFAALKSPSESQTNSHNYWRINLGGTMNLIQGMKEGSCRNLIFSSSASVYGNSQINSEGSTEEQALDPASIYAKTKHICEMYLEDIAKNEQEKWNIAVLRYFNPVGNHKHLKSINPWSIKGQENLFPKIARSIKDKNFIFEVFGNNWNTPDKTAIRDYIHVTDIAKGHILAAEYMKLRKGSYEVFNLGSGKGYSVLEVITMFEEIIQKKINYKVSAKRDGDIAISISNIEKAKQKLKWGPKIALRQMCADSL